MRRQISIYNNEGDLVYSVEVEVGEGVFEELDARNVLQSAVRAAEEELSRRLDQIFEPVTSEEANASLAGLAGAYVKRSTAQPPIEGLGFRGTTGAHPSDCSCSAHRIHKDTEGIKHV